MIKAFVVDMAGLNEIIRILAFLVLAMILGMAAYAYQRIRLDLSTGQPIGEPQYEPPSRE